MKNSNKNHPMVAETCPTMNKSQDIKWRQYGHVLLMSFIGTALSGILGGVLSFYIFPVFAGFTAQIIAYLNLRIIERFYVQKMTSISIIVCIITVIVCALFIFLTIHIDFFLIALRVK